MLFLGGKKNRDHTYFLLSFTQALGRGQCQQGITVTEKICNRTFTNTSLAPVLSWALG